VRGGLEPASPSVAKLAPGDIVTALEHKIDASRVIRVRISSGWVATATSLGTVMLGPANTAARAIWNPAEGQPAEPATPQPAASSGSNAVAAAVDSAAQRQADEEELRKDRARQRKEKEAAAATTDVRSPTSARNQASIEVAIADTGQTLIRCEQRGLKKVPKSAQISVSLKWASRSSA